jgi:hypothetical protein
MSLRAVTLFLADACLWCSGAYVVLGFCVAVHGFPALGTFCVGMGTVIGPALTSLGRECARAPARNSRESDGPLGG